MKKPIFKKWWFWVIVVLVLGMIGSAMGGDKEADATPSVSQTVETATPEPSATPSESPTATPEPSDTGTTLDVAAALLELQIAESFDNYKVDVDEEAKLITVSVWMDGVALEAAAIKEAGGDETNEIWADMKDNLTSLDNSMKKVVDNLNIEKVHVALNLLNDQNTDNVLLSILDGVVFYDVLAE